MDFKQNFRLRSFQVESTWGPCGVHVESVGEGKVQVYSYKITFLFKGYL